MHNVSMEFFLNSVTERNVQLNLPFGETLHSLVNYNSELIDGPTSSHTHENQGAAPLDVRHKLPTKLSKNPSTYEKELRRLVIDLYSDKKASNPELDQSTNISSSASHHNKHGREYSVVQESGCPVLQETAVPLMETLAFPVVQLPRIPMSQGPPSEGASYWGVQRVSAPQPPDIRHMTEPSQNLSESGSEGYYSQGNSIASAEKSTIQSLQELQNYLAKYQTSKQELPSRNVSFSSDLTTPLFDDSGIHLEFTLPFDNDIPEEGALHNTSVNDGFQRGERHSLQQRETKAYPRPSFIVTEDEESEAGHVLEPDILQWERFQGSQRRGDRENGVNENLVARSGHENDPVPSKTDTPRKQMSLSSHVHVSPGSHNPGNEYESKPTWYGHEKKAELVDTEGTRVQILVTDQELSFTVPSSGNNADVFSLENMPPTKFPNDRENRAGLVDTDGMVAMQKPPVRESCHDSELQRAGLEGKLEFLQQEFANVLEERKMLQIRLQAVEARLKEEVEIARETKPTVMPQVNELRKNKAELENQLMKLQSAYEEKSDVLTEALERLKKAGVTIQNLKQKLSVLEDEIYQREKTVTALQIEMDSLRKLLEQAKDQNEQFNNENKALNADIASLVEAKEWLQKQLTVAGEARTKMQLEASELESTMAAKNQLIEKLRCDGVRSVQQLSELQQSSLAEKANILKHMEQVEDGINQQNLAFKELEIDKQRMERTLRERVETLTSENKRLLKLENSAVEIEKELGAAKQDVVLKEALLDAITKEKDEIREELKLARGSTEEYKRNIQGLESKLNEIKQELKTAQKDVNDKEGYIEKLNEEKRNLRENLEVANQERAACDNAIQTLRLDLEKFDRRFKLMKRELVAKKSQLEETTRQKDSFVGELRALREGLENQVSLNGAVKEQLAQKEKLIEEFQEVKGALEKEIGSLNRQLEYSQGEITRMDKERNEVQEKLQSAVREIVQVEERFHQSLLERARLEGELETTKTSNKEETEALKGQNATLRERTKKEKLLLQAEVTKERDKVINLEQELKFITDEIKRKEVLFNQELQTSEASLEEMKSRKEIAEQELKKLHELTEERVEELKNSYESKLEGLKHELASAHHEKVELEESYNALCKKTSYELAMKGRKISQMEKEFSFVTGMLKQTKAEAEQMQLCAIELEREKGRLAGALASQKALREHVVKMENEIATKESARHEMASEVERLKKEEEIQGKTANKRIGMLETKLNDLREESKNLQDAFRKERRENATLRGEVEERVNERAELMKKLGNAEEQVNQLQERMESESSEVKRYRSQLEFMKSGLIEQQTERENLQRKFEAVLEQDMVKDSQIQSLEWEVSRRTKEVEYLEEQFRIMEERQHLEMENLKTALQVSRSETISLRSDLSEARKTKCVYQTKTFELKDSLLSSRQVAELLKQELFVKRQELNSLLEDVLAARNLQQLQEEVTKRREAMRENKKTTDDSDAAGMVHASCLRPIAGLQECMSSLRSQISDLQKQMNDHTDSVLTATTSWRSFKENVYQLQARCSSQNSHLLTAEKDD